MRHPYSRAEYARTLSNIGEPVDVPEWGCSVLSRRIGDRDHDAIGAYPSAVFADSASIDAGLDRLRRMGFVSFVGVAAPGRQPAPAHLSRSFDHVRSFKTHYLRRPQQGPFLYDKHHRYEIRRALRDVEAGPLELASHEAEWTRLYDDLCERHRLGTAHRFTRSHMNYLANCADFRTFGAWHDGVLVSAHIWAIHDGTATSHLAASNETGYRLRAAYAVNAAALEAFGDRLLVNLGGVAGSTDDMDGGLARFKRGFANDEALATLWAAVLDRSRYDRLCDDAGLPRQSPVFFPAYRAPREGISS